MTLSFVWISQTSSIISENIAHKWNKNLTLTTLKKKIYYDKFVHFQIRHVLNLGFFMIPMDLTCHKFIYNELDTG